MKQTWITVVCIGVMLLSSIAAAQQPFTIMTESNPPFNFEKDGEVHGISADLLLLVMEKAGHPVKRSDIQIMPWPRAYQEVQEKPGTVLFSMARTEQRENLFKWMGPIQELTIGLVAPKSKKIVINTPDDAKKYRIGTIRDGAPEQLAITAGFDESLLDRIADPVLNIKKLAADRIDMFAFNVPAIFYMMIQEGMNPDDYEVVFPLKKTALYYAFHKDTDAAVIEKMNQALADLKKPDNTGQSPYDQIIKKYLGGSK
jgi:polar amino acid transport system substrate-binding protein